MGTDCCHRATSYKGDHQTSVLNVLVRVRTRFLLSDARPRTSLNSSTGSYGRLGFRITCQSDGTFFLMRFITSAFSAEMLQVLRKCFVYNPVKVSVFDLLYSSID